MQDNLPDHNMATVWGLHCGTCKYLGDICDGCTQVQGKTFWSALFGVQVCALYDCSVNKRNLEHCGLCGDFPCKLFLDTMESSSCDDNSEQSPEERKNDLIHRAKVGTQKWLEGKV